MNTTQLLTPTKEALNRIYWPAQVLLQQTVTWYMVVGKLIIISALGH